MILLPGMSEFYETLKMKDFLAANNFMALVPFLVGSMRFGTSAGRGQGGGTGMRSSIRETQTRSASGGAKAGTLTIGSFTRDSSLASGDTELTGVGFKAAYAFFMQSIAGANVASWGFDDGTTSFSISTPSNLGIADIFIFQTATKNAIYYVESSTARHTGGVSLFKADGATLSWTKTGSPTNVMTVMYMFFRG